MTKFNTIETAQNKHYDNINKNKGKIDISNLFNLSRKKKNLAPMNEGFVQYVAFKSEEAKMRRKMLV